MSNSTLAHPSAKLDQAIRALSEPAVSSSQVKILMVDDQPSNLMVLETVLEDLGHTLVRVSSGEEALKHLLHEDFAVILLDVYMPSMDGFETAELIRRRERSRSTPIIFMTAIGTTDTDVSIGYSVGGVDYLFKPIVPEILRAKVNAFVDLYLKTAIVAAQAEQVRELERLRHEVQLAEAQRELEAEKLNQEVRAARTIQQLYFPCQSPFFPGYEIAGASYPADATGGDFFDYIRNTKESLDVVIGDVSGHGLSAALVMSATRAYLRALALARTEIDEILELANRALVSDMQGSRFVTANYIRLSSEQRTLNYASAGHPVGYVLDAAGNVKNELHSTSIPLGITTEGHFTAGTQVSLATGDLIFLHTDGVTDALSPTGQPFGAERALQLLRNHRSRSARDLLETVNHAVRHYIGKPPLQDDLTAIVIKVV